MNTTKKSEPKTEIQIHAADSDKIIAHQFISPVHTQRRHTFTVAELDFYLANYNTINRRINDSNMEYLRHCIKTGNFNYSSSDPIIFDVNGVIISGATRMMAHLLEGRDYPCFVHFGVPVEVRKIQDRGQPRTIAQAFILGQNRAVTPAESQLMSQCLAVARVLYCREHYRFSSIPNRMDQLAIENLYLDNMDLIGRAVWKSKEPDAANYKRAGFQAAITIYLKHAPEKAQAFLEAVNGNGANLPDNSPALRCRNYLERSKVQGGSQQRQYMDFRRSLWFSYCDYIGKPVGRKFGTLMNWPKSAVESQRALESTTEDAA